MRNKKTRFTQVTRILTYAFLAAMLLTVSVPRGVAANLDAASITVEGVNATVEFTISGAPEGGMEVTLLVVEKTEATKENPPNEITAVSSVAYIDQIRMNNGKNSVSFPIDESFEGTELRAYIGGNNNTSVIYADTEDAPETISGDINGDDKVDAMDLALLLTDFGKVSADITNTGVDVNGDGKVDALDLAVLLTNFGKSA